MNAFGLTGNMGCGKSAVATLLSRFPDVVILDCDSIAKEIISDTEYIPRINTILGTDIILSHGEIDSRSIAQIIFKDPIKKRVLEDFIHPLVWKMVQKKIDEAVDTKICIVESALIYEKKIEEDFIAVIIAVCNKKEQLRRLRENRKMKKDDIRNRLLQQLPQEEKENRAQYVIRTDCSQEELQRRVKDLYLKLKQQKGNMK